MICTEATLLNIFKCTIETRMHILLNSHDMCVIWYTCYGPNEIKFCCYTVSYQRLLISISRQCIPEDDSSILSCMSASVKCYLQSGVCFFVGLII